LAGWVAGAPVGLAEGIVAVWAKDVAVVIRMSREVKTRERRDGFILVILSKGLGVVNIFITS
jgi:hypothetical protein